MNKVIDYNISNMQQCINSIENKIDSLEVNLTSIATKECAFLIK